MANIMEQCSVYDKAQQDHIEGYKSYKLNMGLKMSWPAAKKRGWREAADQDPGCIQKWGNLFSKILRSKIKNK